MALIDLIDAGKEDIRRICRKIEDGTLDVIVHPMWGTYFNYTYGFMDDEPLLHGSIDLFIKEIISLREKSDHADVPFLMHGELPAMWGDRLSKRFQATATLLQSYQELFTAYERLELAGALADMGGRPYILVLPGKSKKAGLRRRKEFQEFLGYLDRETDGFFIQSIEEDSGKLFDHQADQKQDTNRNLQAIQSLCDDNDIRNMRAWGGYVNRCLAQTVISMQAAISCSPDLSLEKCECAPSSIHALLHHPYHKNVSGLVGIKGSWDIASYVNLMIHEPFDISMILPAAGRHPIDQRDCFRQIPSLSYAVVGIKKVYALDYSIEKELRRSA